MSFPLRTLHFSKTSKKKCMCLTSFIFRSIFFKAQKKFQFTGKQYRSRGNSRHRPLFQSPEQSVQEKARVSRFKDSETKFIHASHDFSLVGPNIHFNVEVCTNDQWAIPIRTWTKVSHSLCFPPKPLPLPPPPVPSWPLGWMTITCLTWSWLALEKNKY